MTASVRQHPPRWCSDAQMEIGWLSQETWLCVMATPFSLRYHHGKGQGISSPFNVGFISTFFSPFFLLQLNIGCESEFSAAAPVLLQYSHDAGRTWALVREGCYPGTPGSGVCEGSGRELREPTVYNTGDYEQWTRVTVVIPRNVAAR